MSAISYPEFFQAVAGSGKFEPYPYQIRLACGESGGDSESRDECESMLIDVPTGMGKTGAVTMAWLWNRVVLGNENWPRRLVYCLPMRTLVEQTRDNVAEWLEAMWQAYPSDSVEWLKENSPVILMGGEKGESDGKEWDLYPEREAILIGTQDMLLSRALNRGYGMSRFRWPMHFGLLNNDCLWVLDETQLMGPGLWTSAQLDWLRHDRFKPERNCVTWWMSATVGTRFLETKDRADAQMPSPKRIEIDIAEAAKLDILKATRPVSIWQPSKVKDRKDRNGFTSALATAIHHEHAQHALSLVVCNTVASAQEIFAALGSGNTDGTEIILLTSRFRPADRKAHLDKLFAFENARKAAVKNCDAAPRHNGLICVSTQVIEAGVDISALRLWTELAPWPSVLQRLGRLNRDGKLNSEAAAYVFEIPTDKNAASPYELNDLKTAKKIIKAVADRYVAAPDAPIRDVLSGLNGSVCSDIAKSLEPKPTPFPRAFDVHGLFSTDPDVFGGFTDVSPWVRGDDRNADVTVFWRDWDASKKPSPNPAKNEDFVGSSFERDEACSVAVYRIRNFVKSSKSAFIWNDRTEKWKSIKHDEICPGMVVMLPASRGGYDVGKGWTGNKTDKLENTPPPGPFDDEGENVDKHTTGRQQWVPLRQHLGAVADEAEKIADALELTHGQKTALVRAADLHDIGKSFPQWHDALSLPRPDETTLWAKAPSFAKRAGMRHEAASALAAWWRYYRDNASDFPALTIYLIAAHHGIVRTVLNSRAAPAKQPNVAGIPVTDPPPDLPINGWQLDFTPASDGANGTFSENTDGELVFMSTAPSWSALVADLLGGWEADTPQATAGAVPENEPHSLNPFQLAFLETLLRAADCRTSASETGISNSETAKQ